MERFIPAMPDYTEGIKKEVAEVKFLIHDLRVEASSTRSSTTT